MPKKGYRITQKHREHLQKSARKRKHSDETKNKISLKLVGTHPKEHTKDFMRRREKLKRELHLKLMDHLQFSHPKVLRKQFKGWHVWKNCPECSISTEKWKLKKVPVVVVRKKAQKRIKESNFISLGEEGDMFAKAIQEEIKLGIKKDR